MPVRPVGLGTSNGLGQATEEEKHMYITTEGEMFPKDHADRDAEIEGFELDGADGASPVLGEGITHRSAVGGWN